MNKNIQYYIDKFGSPSDLTLEEVTIMLQDNCYDIVEHSCNGSCQGCTNCIMAQHFKGIRKHSPTRRDMYKQELDGLRYRNIMNGFAYEYGKNPELDKALDNMKKAIQGG